MPDIAELHSPEAIMAASAPREHFGPGSAYPYVVVEARELGAEVARWLGDLTCPVVAIGAGDAPGWADVMVADERELAVVAANIRTAPIAAMVLVQHLRASAGLSLTDALTAESFAYATLQQGPEFLGWLEASLPPKPAPLPKASVMVERAAATLTLTLADPANRNAINTRMRDELCTALDLALADNSIERVELNGDGRVFSSGGEFAEFGEVGDPATAHHIRSLRLPAWRLARLGERLHVHVNGAAIGAGAEMAAFGTRVTAGEGAWFQLPELKFGLIPGAGGTASLPRRIGRHRTAWLALTMKRINAQTALDWGLVDEIVP